MSATTRRTKKVETLLSLTILGFLVAISLVILTVQNRLNPAVENFTPKTDQTQATLADASTENVVMTIPPGIKTMSPAESFNPDTLSNKINGKAELYLSAGFVQLKTQRFQPADNSSAWFEIYIYDMGSPSNAFAVYSTQRRQDVEKVSLTEYAYQTSNALFFTAGQHYVEMIAATPSAAATSTLMTFAEQYLDNVQEDAKDQTETADPKSAFPTEDLVADSIALIAKDAFGFSQLDQVYTARYQGTKMETTLFVSLRTSSEEATKLAEAYRDFLIEFGGTQEPLPASVPIEGLFTIQILDAIELIFTRGSYLAGVHMAEDMNTASHWVVKLDRQLNKIGAIP